MRRLIIFKKEYINVLYKNLLEIKWELPILNSESLQDKRCFEEYMFHKEINTESMVTVRKSCRCFFILVYWNFFVFPDVL